MSEPDDAESFLELEDSEYEIERTRDCAQTWRRMTTAWARNKSFGNSKEYLTKAIKDRNARVERLIAAELKRRPRSAEAYALRGALPWRRDFAGVKADFDRAERFGLRCAPVLMWRGTVKLKMLDRVGGLADLRAALEQKDATAWTYAWVGRALLTQFRNPEGLKLMDRAAEMAPRWPKIFAWRSEARRHLGDIAGMNADYERALSLKPGRGLRDLMRGFRGMALLKLGRVDEAIENLEAARVAAPRRSLWMHGMSTAWRLKGRLDLWIHYFDMAANRSLKYENMPGGMPPAERDAALRDLETLLASDPKNAIARLWRAKFLLASGRVEEAETELAAATAADPKNAAFWLWYAEALRARGRAREALGALERAAKLKPRGQQIAVSRARALADLGEHKAALACYDAAIKIEKVFALAHAERGALLLKMGRARDARKALELALELNARDARALVDLAVARRRSGDARGAKDALARARALDEVRAGQRLAVWNPRAAVGIRAPKS